MKLLVLTLLLLTSCGKKQGPAGTPGNSCSAQEIEGQKYVVCTDGSKYPIYDGQNGADGEDGTIGPQGNSIATRQVSILVDRALTPWEDNNKVYLENDGILFLPTTFFVTGIPKENNEWIDIKVGNRTLCYQGLRNKFQYDYKYTKIIGAITGCDNPLEKDAHFQSTNISFKYDDVLQVIPRTSKLTGLQINMFFDMIVIEE